MCNLLYAKKFDQYDIEYWDKLEFIAIHYNRIKYLLIQEIKLTNSINKTNNEQQICLILIKWISVSRNNNFKDRKIKTD